MNTTLCEGVEGWVHLFTGFRGTSTRITGFKIGELDLVEFRGQKWMVFARRGRKAGTKSIWKETKGGEVRGPSIVLI